MSFHGPVAAIVLPGVSVRFVPPTASAHPELAREIAQYLGLPMGQCRLRRFPDTEVSFQIDENIRGTDVFIVQPTCAPVDSHLMELMIWIDCLKRASASRVTAVIPYFGYARQDRKDEGRTPITAKLVANLIERAGARSLAGVSHSASMTETTDASSGSDGAGVDDRPFVAVAGEGDA